MICFVDASSFNQDIGNWDVSQVTDMNSMFFGASAFNGNIGNWEDKVGRVTDMHDMFLDASSFNQDIGNWDVSQVTDMNGMFAFATSFNGDIGNWEDKVGRVTDMHDMFLDASSFNQDIGNWDVSQVRDMSGMFDFAASFDQDIGNWDVSQVHDMGNMFSGVTLSTENYDALLSGWSELPALQSTVQFHAGDSEFCNVGAKGVLMNTYGWVITDDGLADNCPIDTEAFITIWRTTDDGESITIPTHDGSTYNYNVDWGDGTVDFARTEDEDASHNYATPGTYTVSITGDFPRIFFDFSGDRDKIIFIEQWGNIIWSSMESAFAGCINLRYNADDDPDLSQVTDMSQMFDGATVFDGDIGNWDVSQVTDMNSMFLGASAFNGNIGNWEDKVGQVTDMHDMFVDASSFNQDIGNWDVSQVTDMNSMFLGASAFNGNIGNWEDKVGRVTDMHDMFVDASSFNQDIGNWDVSQVTDMNGMFVFAISFNGDIGNWGNKVGRVTDMHDMFLEASSFNQDIGNWDISQVRYMSGMFDTATSFDQNIGQWNVSQVRNMDSMFSGVTLSTENYDALLSGWSELSSLQSPIQFHAGDSKFCNVRAKGVLVNPSTNSWDIIDGGLADNCPQDTEAFITTWAIMTDGESITIPTHDGSTYNYNVDWGDGTVDFARTEDEDTSHNYASSGTYTVSITGDFPRIFFENYGDDRNKIISIEQWGNIVWSSMESAFEGCTNLRYNDDASPPVLSSVTSTSKMFRNAIVFNGNIGNWDVSSITNMEFMFTSARSFDQDIGRWNVSQVRSMRAMFSGLFAFDGDISNWDVSQVTNMSGMLSGVTLSTENYDALLLGWSQLPSLQRNVTFSAGESKFCNIDAKEALANTPWDIFDRGREDNKFCDRPYVVTEIPNMETNAGTDFSYTFPEETFNDMNTDTLTYTVNYMPALPAWLSFHLATRTFSGTPTYTNIGTISITITATDELGVINMDNMAEFSLTVPNRPPIINNNLEPQTAYVGMPFMYNIENVFSDPDGGPLRYLSREPRDRPIWLSFTNGIFSATPAITNIGIYTITVAAIDSHNSGLSRDFILTVPNRPPIVEGEGLVNQSAVLNTMFSYPIEGVFSDPDGEQLSYQVNGRPSWLSFDTPTLTFSGTPTQTTDLGISTITVTVADHLDEINTSNFTLNVVLADRPTTLLKSLQKQTAYVGIPFIYDIEGAFSDPDGGSLNYQVVGQPRWLSFDTPTLTFSGTPTNTNDIRISTITVTATDQFNSSVSSTFTLTVPNQPPIVEGEGLVNQNVALNTTLFYSIEGAFSDPDGESESLSYSTDENLGWLSFDTPTLTFSGTPTSTNDIGVTIITVTVTDLNDGSVSSSFTLTVPNRLPIQTTVTDLTTQIAVIGKRFSYIILEGAFIDPDGGSLSYAYTPDENQTWLSFDTPTLTFSGTPPSDTSTGINTVFFTVTDLNGGSVNSHFILNIVTVNRPPELRNPLRDQRTYVNRALVYLIEGAFSDPEDGSLLYSAKGNPGWLDFSSESRIFSGTPPTVTDIGTSTITVTAADLNGGSTSDTFTVTVDNRIPRVNEGLASTSVFVGDQFSYEIPGNAFSDGDIEFGDTLTYTTNINPQSTWLSFDTPTLTFSGTPTNVTDIGITTITVTATDLNDGSVNNSFTVTVGNRIPTVNEGLASTSVFVGVEFSYKIPGNAFSDGDIMYDDTLAYTANINPQSTWLTFSSKTRTFSGTPTNTDHIGISTVTVTATDLNGGSTSDTFTVTVDNRIPTIGTGLKDREAFVGVEFSYEIPGNAFSDPDGGTLSYSTDENLDWLSFNTPTLIFSGTPTNVTDIGITTITVTATDLNDGSVNNSFTLTVGNRIPTVNEGLASTSVFVGAEFSYEIPENAFSDGDIAFGDTLTYTANINPQDNWLTFSSKTRTFSGTPTNTDHIGISTVTVTAIDLNGGSTSDTFTVTVDNRIPTIGTGLKDREAFVGVGFSYEILETAFSDPDGGTLSYSTDENLDWLSFNTPMLTFSGTPSTVTHIGVTIITVTVTDLNDGSVSSSFTLTVPNRLPIQTTVTDLTTRVAVIGRGFSYNISGAFIDPDGGSLSYAYTPDEDLGWLMFSSEIRTFFGTPPSDTSTGINTVFFTVTDLNGGSVNSHFILNVVASNRPPELRNPLRDQRTYVNRALVYLIEGAFSDPEDGSLLYSAKGNPGWLDFSSESRTFSGTPPTVTDIGISTITVTATDLNGGSTSDTFTVTVDNRIPAVNEGLASTSVFVGDQFSYEIPGNAFSDGDIMYDDTLTYTANINSQSTWLSFNTPTLTFSGTPTNTDDIGITTITVTATDLNGGNVNSSFTVTVVNRVPTVNERLASTSVFVGDQFSYEIPGNAFSDGDIMYDDTLAYTANINPQGTWLSFNTPTLTFSGTPTNVSDIGITTITVTATDLNGDSVNNSFTVTVDNRIPAVNERLASTSVFVGAEFSYKIPGNAFSDGDIMYDDTLTYTANINPQDNWLSFNTDTFSGTPTSTDDIGISTITVTATDLNGGSTSDTFTVTVDNRIPRVNEGLASTSVFVGDQFSYEIPGNAFSDGDIMYDDTLTYTANINSQSTWLSFNTPTLTFSGTPTSTDIGISTITVTATDLNGGSMNSSFTVTVPPTARRQ